MNFRIDDLKSGPKATMQKLNPWAEAIRWILDWIDAQPANANQGAANTKRMIVVIGGQFYEQNVVVVGEPTILT